MSTVRTKKIKLWTLPSFEFGSRSLLPLQLLRRPEYWFPFSAHDKSLQKPLHVRGFKPTNPRYLVTADKAKPLSRDTLKNKNNVQDLTVELPWFTSLLGRTVCSVVAFLPSLRLYTGDNGWGFTTYWTIWIPCILLRDFSLARPPGRHCPPGA